MKMLVYGSGKPTIPNDGAPMHGALKYHGDVATGYDAKGENNPKWHLENQIVRDYLEGFPAGTTLLDCPIGTGRFIPLYVEKEFVVTGMDISSAMLDEARKKVPHNGNIELKVGSVLNTCLPANFVDVAIMFRLTRWLTPEQCGLAMKELQRVAKQAIIFTARVRNHPHQRPYEIFLEASGPDWQITEDRPADGEDYRVIKMEAR